MASEGVGTVDLDTIVNLDDLERAAERVMDKQDFDYFAGGSPSFPETPEFSRSFPPPPDAPPVPHPRAQAPRPRPRSAPTPPRTPPSVFGRGAWWTSPTSTRDARSRPSASVPSPRP